MEGSKLNHCERFVQVNATCTFNLHKLLSSMFWYSSLARGV